MVETLERHVIYSSAGLGSVHPEMFDENGNVIPDEILQYDLKTIMTTTKRTTTKRKSTTTRKPAAKKSSTPKVVLTPSSRVDEILSAVVAERTKSKED